MNGRSRRRLAGALAITLGVMLSGGCSRSGREPDVAVRDGLLRQDLLYRLDVASVEMPV